MTETPLERKETLKKEKKYFQKFSFVCFWLSFFPDMTFVSSDKTSALTFKWGTKRRRELIVVCLTITLRIVVCEIKYFDSLHEQFSSWGRCLVKTQQFAIAQWKGKPCHKKNSKQKPNKTTNKKPSPSPPPKYVNFITVLAAHSYSPPQSLL